MHVPLILINLTPLNPPLLLKERGKLFGRGAKPLLNSFSVIQEDICLCLTPSSPFEGLPLLLNVPSLFTSKES
jgi:hypothetical protein